METRSFFVSRETVPGLYTVVNEGLLYEFQLTFENVMLKRDLQTGHDPIVGTEMVERVILPLLLSCGAVKEDKNGYITEYSSLQLAPEFDPEEHRKFWQTRNFYDRKRKSCGPQFIFIKPSIKTLKRVIFSR